MITAMGVFLLRATVVSCTVIIAKELCRAYDVVFHPAESTKKSTGKIRQKRGKVQEAIDGTEGAGAA